VIFLVQLHYKIYGYLIALILSNVAAISILATGVPFTQTAVIKLSPDKIKEMLRYSVPLIPNSIMWYLTNFASRYVLVFMLGVSESGIYAASSKIPGALSALIYVFINAWEISAVDTAQTEQSEVKNQFYSNIFEIFVAVTSIVTAGMILFSRLIAFIFINHSYGPVWRFIPVLLLSNVFLSYSTFLGTNYIVEKKTNAVLKTTVYGAIANILVSMALVSLIGIMGACVGNAAGFFIVLVLRYHNLQKTNSLGINFKNAVINGLIVILMVLVMAFTQDLKIQIGLNVVLMLGLGLWNFKSLKLIFQQIWGKNK
jgi:O-antigen/teichoic acid export membrane protein